MEFVILSPTAAMEYSAKKAKKKMWKGKRTHRPSTNQVLALLLNPQFIPNQGCSVGTHGSPFHPRRVGKFKDCFNICNAHTAHHHPT
jgi:hypothetical protein